MNVVVKVVIILAVSYGLYKWLSFRRKKVIAYIETGMFEGKPVMHCSIGNYFGAEAITVNECHLILDGQHTTVPFRDFGISLPYLLSIHQGIGFSFDPVPIVTKAREVGKKKCEVRAFFQDSVGRTYLSKPFMLPTDSKRFSWIFEQQDFSESIKRVSDIAQEIAEQFNQQLVEMPHIVLALVREQNGVAGEVLRELGLREDFLLELAKNVSNLSRNLEFPHPYKSMEVHQAWEYMRNQALEMRQKCFGTGHLLLGLTRQKNEAFLIILNHLEVQPAQLRKRTYEVLRKDQHHVDHPTLPPEGIKRYVWMIQYRFTHTSLVIFFHVIEWLFPDFEI